MNKNTYILFLSTIISLYSFSQEISYCGNKTVPLSDSLIQAINNFSKYDVGRAPLIKVPTVVHVFTNNTDLDIIDMIEGINRDLANSNADIELCLAKVSPSGNPTTGIVHATGNTNYNFGGKTSGPGPANIGAWDVNEYMNMYIVDNISGTTSGFAGLPWNTSTGILTDPNAPYNAQLTPNQLEGLLGFDGIFIKKAYAPSSHPNKTPTHEVGHYLGLPHTFLESGSCGDGDGLNCTGNTQKTGDICGVGVCGNAGHEQNIMQYSNSGCKSNFLGCQSSVMRYVLNNQRNTLRLGNLCDPAFDLSVNTITITKNNCLKFDTRINVTNLGSQSLTSFTIRYSVNGGGLVNYNWTGNLNSGASTNINLPELTGEVGPNEIEVIVRANSLNNNRDDQDLSNDSEVKTFSFSANTPKVAVTSSKNSVCEGESVTLTASGGSNYSWSPGGSTSNSITVSPNNTTTYTLSGQAGGCPSSDTKEITVKPLPNTNFSFSDNNVCPGTSVQLSGSGADDYLWNSGSTNTNRNVSSNSTTSYTLVGTTNGCSTTKTRTLNVKNPPTLNLSSSSNGVCPNDEVIITASGNSNSYLWTSGEISVSIVKYPTQTTTFSVTGTHSNGCTETKTKTIQVYAFEEAIIGGPDFWCEDSEVEFMTSSSSIKKWALGKDSLIASNFVNKGSSNSQQFTVKSDSVIRLIVKASPQCPDTAYQLLKMNIKPILSSGITEVCLDENTQYNLGIICQTTKYDINQYQNTTIIDIIKPITMLDSINNFVAVDDSGCSSDNLEILARLTPDVNVQLSEREGCDPLEVYLSFTCDFGGNIVRNQWDLGDGNYSDIRFPIHTYNYGTFDIFSVHEFTNSCIDSVILLDTLYVERRAEASIVADKYSGDKIYSVFNFTDDSRYHNSVIWTIDEDYITDDSTFRHDFLDVGFYDLTLFATTPLNCMDSTSVKIEVNDNEHFTIPNSFTPNGDGINETFKPLLNVKQDQILKYEFRVFDKWGNLVFETEDQTQSWDGKVNGNFVGQTVFVWQLDIDYYEYTSKDLKSFNQKGHVLIIDNQ